MGLSTTTVGWFPKPHRLTLARWRCAEGSIDETELQQVEQQETAAAIEQQQESGLDQIVEGQMDRGDMVSSFVERLDGAEAGGLVRCFGNRFYRRPRIVDNLARPAPITVTQWSVARKLTSHPLKAVLTGPYTLMDWSFDEHYRSREACCMALAEIVRQEVEELAAAGAQEIQIDEPAISARPEEVQMAGQALARVTSSVTGRARTWVHLCYGDLAPVIAEVLKLPVDGLLLEMVNSDFEILEALSDLPPERLLGAGVLDVHDRVVESVQTIGQRVERLLQTVPAERLWLMPDSGLRTLEPETARDKLTNLVEAAGKF